MSVNSKNVLTIIVMMLIVIVILVFSNISKAETAKFVKTTDVTMDSIVDYRYPSRQDSMSQDTAKKLTNKEFKEKMYKEFKSKSIRQEKNLEQLEYQNKIMDSLINKKDAMKKNDGTRKKLGT
jgi:preprotein translocase subunit SecF